jgi:ABC-type multidrug transport system permease subunit
VSASRRQASVLAARYRDCILGDKGGLFLLLAQAPLIGWLCAVVWGSIESDTPGLYFVLCLAAVWFGCINACREIVKERAILERERLFGIRPVEYILSKVWVLAGLGAVQVVLLQGTVEWHLQLRGPMPVELLALFGASVAGSCLGLLVSALATTQERAVFAVPLLLLPQILFSELAIPNNLYSDVVSVVEKLMPVHWAFRVFEESAALEPSWFMVVLSLLILAATALALLGLATLALLPQREVVT